MHKHERINNMSFSLTFPQDEFVHVPNFLFCLIYARRAPLTLIFDPLMSSVTA